MGESRTITYQNPVYDGYFADPFVWRVGQTYWAIGTGDAVGGRQFPLLRSADLVHWEPAGGALVPSRGYEGAHFWAPEVAYEKGTFYLYYSAGRSDEDHRLMVAASDRPEGPYEQVAGPLVDPTVRPFTIDPHPFRDDDGQWYLFYARDFLDTEHGNRAGTALVVDRLDQMTHLAGQERTVLRARHNWQLFLAQRPMYGKIFDWHTLEGPTVRKHGGKYYCLYSGSNWQTENYGVDFAVADTVMGPYDNAGADSGPRVLRTVPGKVRGPGHNSVVTGPDGKTDWICYHAWDPQLTARKLCIDPLIWTPDGPRCNGPTWEKVTLNAEC